MIWKEIDLFDIAKDIKPEILGNEIFIDLSNVEANGHKENVDNRKIECIRAMGGGIDLDSVEKVLLSLDNVNYENIDLKDRLELDEQGRLEINLHEDYKVKFIKIIWNSRIPTQNIKIEVLNRKFVGLAIAQMSLGLNGWGDRIISQFGALDYAERHGYKFGFVWKAYDGALELKCKNTNIFMEEQEFIFSREYIEKYSYNSILNKYYPNGYTTDIRDDNPKPFYWGGFISGAGHKSEAFMPKMWEKIGFNKDVQDVLNTSRNIALKFLKNNDYVCINMRIGDMIYAKPWYNGISYICKVTPAEIVIALIERLENITIILLSDVSETMRNIENYFKNSGKQVYCAVDILPKQNNLSKKALQEIVFMSMGKEIYDHGGSGFARLASLIGFGRGPRSWDLDFTIVEQLEAINNNFDKIKRSKEERGFSKHFAYTLYRKTYPDNWEGMSRILLEAVEIFPENIKYKWRLAECYIKLNKPEKAQKQLEEMLKIESIDEILRSFNTCEKDYVRDESGTLKITFPLMTFFLKKINNKNIELQKQKAEIVTLKYKLQNNAKTRIQNQLNYKLGKAIIENSKSFWGYIRMPYVLSYIAEIHNKELANRKEKLPKLETLPDYKEALKIKNQMSYKIGEAFVKGCKTWYKGGLIKFYFETQRIKKNIKK